MATPNKQARKTRSHKSAAARDESAAAVAAALHIRGRILRSNGSPFGGLTAIAFDKDVAGENVLGRGVASVDGIFEIAYTDAQFRRSKDERGGADVFLRVYDGEKLVAETKVTRNAPAELNLDITVPAMKFVVRGTVTDSDGVPAAGVVVRAFDRDLRKENALGSTVADTHGVYAIAYESGKFARAEKGTADLIVRVFADEASASPIAESELRVNAGEDTTIDITIPAREISEWERITNAVLPLLVGQGKDDAALPPWEINESDISFIDAETGLPANQIALWALAVKTPRLQQLTVKDTGLASSLPKHLTHAFSGEQTSGGSALMVLLYGWFRDGQPTVFADLLQRSNESLLESSRRAVAQGYIPALDNALFEALSATLDALRGSQQLRPSSDPEAGASLGDTLRLLPDADRLQLDKADGPGARLATLLANASPASPPSWERRLEAVGDESLLRSVQRSIGLHDLTGGFVPWIRALQQGASSDTDPTLADLVSMDAADWIEFARKNGVPSKAVGATDEERFVNFGREIAGRIDRLHPTLCVQDRIAKGRIPIPEEVKAPLNRFIGANPAFRLRETPLLSYLGSSDFNAADLEQSTLAAVSAELMKVERVATLVPLLDYVGPLLSANFDSARSIVSRRSRDAFTEELRDVIGDDTQAGRIYDTAAGVLANTEALVLLGSPRFSGRELPVIAVAGQATQNISAAGATGAVAAAGTGALALPPNLQQLFGNQDYCECAHGASLYGPAAYLADLLQMLSRTTKLNGRTALQVLLQRRPDIAEVDLTGDNAEIRLPYIDLVLEVLEQPDWEASIGFRVLRGGTEQNPTNAFDAFLDRGEIPAGLVASLASWGVMLSEHRSAGRAADVQNSGGATFRSWLIRDHQTGMKLRLVGVVAGAYRLYVYPQSVAGTPKGYRPWSSSLSAVVRNVASARFPWSLPFDVNRDESDAWLHRLGATREDITLALAGASRWSNVEAACAHLGLAPATRELLTTAPDAARPEYRDWGFANAAVGAEGIVDPIAGMAGTLTAGQIRWSGAETRPADPPDWFALLKNVSLLRSRSQLNHRDLLNVLEMRFVCAGGARFEITGDECRTALMRLEAMSPPLARRLHLFVRLHRLTGWSASELDAALLARPGHLAGAGSSVALTPASLLFIGNIARLSARTGISVATCLDMFSAPTLDTAWYWNHDGAQPVRTQSRYEAWFDNANLGRPRVAEFQLNPARDALAPRPSPATGLPRARLSDHASYIAAALGLPESELAPLLPVGIVGLPPVQVSASVVGAPVRVGNVSGAEVEVLIGALSAGAAFTLTLQHSDDGAAFQDVPAAQLAVANPWPISATTPILSRFAYAGTKPYLRVAVAPTAGANPSLWVSARVLIAAGRVNDELTLTNLTTLCRHAVLRRLIGRSIPELLTLQHLAGLDPSLAAATPDLVLTLLDGRDAIAACGLTIAEADQLLSGPIAQESNRLETQAQALLATARAAHQAIISQSTVALDQRSVLLAKILIDHGWDAGRIAMVLGATQLGAAWGDYEVAVGSAVTVPLPILYDAALQKLVVSGSVRPSALRAAIAPVLAAASGDLADALTRLDDEARSREERLALLASLLRDKSPPTFKTDWSLPATVSLAIPSAWKGRFFFERGSRKLCFVGWMSPTDKQALLALATPAVAVATPTLQAAVDDLSNQSQAYVPDASNMLVVRQGSAGLSVEALVIDIPTLQDRCGALLDLLLPEWRRGQLRTKLAEAIALAVGDGASVELADALLSLPVAVAVAGVPATNEQRGFEWLASDAQLLASDPVTDTSRAAYPQTFDAAAQLLVLGQFAVKLGLAASELNWLRGSWTGIDFTRLPTRRTTTIRADLWTSLIALSTLLIARKNPRVGPIALASMLAAARQPAVDPRQLAIVLSSTETNLRELVQPQGLNIATPAWLRDPLQLVQLLACVGLCRELNITAVLLIGAGRAHAASRQAREAEAEAQALRQTALGRNASGSWSDEENKVLDTIRQRRRDATVDYLIHQRQVRDADDLYGDRLIDPQMGPCMMTSRIVQAISSVQLFIQRCFMALEPGVAPAAIDKGHWAWMKNYRVWEANRKVLFYPENWIEPELRDDKTPFFDDVVSALQQGDANDVKAEAAVQKFLEALTDLSKVDIVATCSHYDDSRGHLLTHVFARSLSEPHTYWHRQFRNLDPGNARNSLGTWTPWKAVPLDIEGQHLFPFVWRGRLFLFWAIFSQQADEPRGTEMSQQSGAPPTKYWRLKLAWSELKGGAWTGRRIAQERLLYVNLSANLMYSPDEMHFHVSPGDSGVTIRVYWARDPTIFSVLPKPYDGVKWLETPLSVLHFDGHQVRVAYALFSYRAPVGGNSLQLVEHLAYSTYSPAETPIDTATVTIAAHRNMKISVGTQALQLREATNVPVDVGGARARDTTLLYAPEEATVLFSAPSVLFPPRNVAARGSKAVPFVVSDWQHRFFVYPAWQPKLQLNLLPTPNGIPSLSFDIYEAPTLHFYALDWPQSERLRKTLFDGGVPALLSFTAQDRVANPPVRYFDDYKIAAGVAKAWPDGDLEYSPNSAQSTYNFELFFHVPFAVACALSKNQRFEEARRWFHFIFDPTDTSSDASPGRYWRFRPFRDSPGARIDELIARLADPNDRSTAKLEFQSLIAQWKDQPFSPHLVARARIRSYMLAVVMKYLDNLIAWADQLFRRDTMESINEATQLYILAAQILGRRPERLPHRRRPTVHGYTDLAAAPADDLANALVDAENLIPTLPAGGGSAPVTHLQSLYFCLPGNPRVDDYADRVEAQLYKLRNCMNIDGVVRELALFSPEIDPGLLVKAAAAGVDVSSALADLQAPLPLYRFNVMAQKATELCAEVRSLGGALLAAIEKGDAEAMARLRSSHELALAGAVRLVTEAQIQEAKAGLDALGEALLSAKTKFAHYAGLVCQVEPFSIPSGPVVGPTLQGLAAEALESLSTATAFVDAMTPVIDPLTDSSTQVLKQILARASNALAATLPPEGMDTASVPMNPAEKRQLDELKGAHDLQSKAADQRLLAQTLAMIPDFTIGVQGMASSPVVQFQLGGTLLSKVANFAASATDSKAGEHTYRATLHSMLAGYQRRAADWLMQAQLASYEIAQIGAQIKANTLRIAIAAQELRNHDRQMANTREVDELMRTKFGNQELFSWMSGQLSRLYFQAYQLAYDVAKRAERCFAHELGVDATFIQFGYWDGLKRGLLAGEMLQADIRRMEAAYMNQNARELEITKHVSLLTLDPAALVRLRETGECEFSVPEVLYDLDFPGHYFRRIRSVSVSVPCVAGPYTSLSSTLTLLSSKVRVRSTPANQSYADDQNFRQSSLPTQSIATSTGQNDSGMFELSFRDERYLPFEGAGAIGRWRLTMPQNLRPFDYSTITDVVLHVRYTSRDAGGVLKRAAQDSLIASVNALGASGAGFNRLFSLKQDFSTEWERFKQPAGAQDPRSEFVALSLRRFPFLFTGKSTALSVVSLSIFVVPSSVAQNRVSLPDTFRIAEPGATAGTVLQPVDDVSIGPLLGKAFAANGIRVQERDEDAKWKLILPSADVAAFRRDSEDLLLVVNYSLAAV